MPEHAPGQHPANRLQYETSPYLQQHARNPVDWFPWGEEAFEKARREEKPIFLSVGYSACHWCHVMERESFENDDIARFLNEHYVSIKVDREERPDVDQIYMTAVQLITQRGGWPMSVFMTPEGKPFYGGTYWPPVSRMGMPGFGDLLRKLHDYWIHKRDEVDESAAQLVEAIDSMAAPIFEKADLNEQVLQHAMTALLRAADRRLGGFGLAPKFPQPMAIRVLLRCAKRFHNEEALQFALQTLDRMARGGIFDQLGGGFHRYATDANWLVPHFEKMLYDNALLVPAYLEAFQISKNPQFETTVRATLDYVLREMTDPAGGFYSTQDADSEGEEGKFFVWTEAEVDALLSPEEATAFKSHYDVSAPGNWEGRNILHQPRTLEESAAALHREPTELRALLDQCCGKLLAARDQRIRPGRDEKILTSWNGMMISALAMAARVLDEPKYLTAAQRAAEFLLTSLRNEEGRLWHSYKDGQARHVGYLDDYACLIDGLTELFSADSQPSHLIAARELAATVQQHFACPAGGYYYVSDDHEQLIVRTKDSQDNATPSGNGMLATALLKLARLTLDSSLEQAALATLDSLGALLQEHPLATAQSLLALDVVLSDAGECIVVDRGDPTGFELWRELQETFLPQMVSFRWTGETPVPVLGDHLSGKSGEPDSGLFVCTRGQCSAPIRSRAALQERFGD